MNPFKNLKNLFTGQKEEKLAAPPNTAPPNTVPPKTTEPVPIDEQELLHKYEEDFNKKREDYGSTRNIWYTVAVSSVSIGIFVYVFFLILGQPSFHDMMTELNSKEFVNNELASAISLSASFALIIPVIYTIARVMKTQQRNAEISNLNLQIRNMRSRIIQQKQEKFTTVEDTDTIRSIVTDIEIMFNSLKSLDDNYVAKSELENTINAIRTKYSDYQERIRYKYEKILGATFNKVHQAILEFMNLRHIVPNIYGYDGLKVQSTISLLNEALLSLRTLKGATNP